MEESILNTTKKLLGVDPDYDSFDTDIIVCINAALGVLNQLGVGPDEGFQISGSSETWDDFIPDDTAAQEMAETYIFLKCRLMFDPPQASGAVESIKSLIAEYEWRLFAQVDPSIEEDPFDEGGEG